MSMQEVFIKMLEDDLRHLQYEIQAARGREIIMMMHKLTQCRKELKKIRRYDKWIARQGK